MIQVNISDLPHTYPARRRDAETGLMQYRTGYYWPDAGRFISRDSIGVWGDPNSLGNGYAYVGNMGHGAIDPSGASTDDKFTSKKFKSRPGGGLVVFEFFISEPTVMGQKGDGRPFTEGVQSKNSRVVLWLDFEKGRLNARANHSCNDDSKKCKSAHSFGKKNKVKVNDKGSETTLIGKFTNSLKKGAPAIDIEFTFDFEASNIVVLDTRRDGYPSVEMLVNGRHTPIAEEQTLASLGPPMEKSERLIYEKTTFRERGAGCN